MKLSDVSSSRSAPMGRRDTHSDCDAHIKLIVHHCPFVDGDYDEGGAYWGAGEPLWRAIEPEGDVEFFLRGKDRWEVLEDVRELYPNSEIIDTPRERWFEEFLTGYQEAALWSSIDTIKNDEGEEETVHLDDGYEMHEETKAKFRQDCKDFCDFAEPQLRRAIDCTGYGAVQAGHDLWLTRAGHGAGYWDRGQLPRELREQLSDAARDAGSRELYIGDDGLIHQG